MLGSCLSSVAHVRVFVAAVPFKRKAKVYVRVCALVHSTQTDIEGEANRILTRTRLRVFRLG